MIINNLKIAFRSLLNNKVYTVINILGLATGLSVVLLISLYVKDDLSFDRFHAHGHKIYRLVADLTNEQGEVRKMGNTGFIQGPTFKEEIPEVESFCRFRNGWNTLVKKGNDAFKEDLMYADNSIFYMFSIQILQGDKNNALNKINSIVITEKMAEKYFDSKDVIGKTMYVGDLAEEMVAFEVTGVIKSLPTNSSIQFDLLCNIDYSINKEHINLADQSWYNSSLNTFVMLQDKAELGQVSQKLNAISKNHVDKEYQEEIKSVPNAKPFKLQYKLQPFYEMHLDPEYYATNGIKHWSDIKYPKILSGIALLLIIVAAINFINLSLARSLQRTKEIGIRKATGSTRWQLFTQFLNEAIFTTCIAAIPAFVLAYSLMPAFSELTGKYLAPQVLLSPETLAWYTTLVLLIAIISGGYPAYVMSGFQPIESLKGKALFGTKSTLRKSLVVFQFTLAGVLMIGTAFLTQQFRYINSKPLGFETEDRYRFWLPWDEVNEIGENFKGELRKLNDVEMVSSKSGDFNMTKYRIDGEETDWVYYEHIDDHHLQLMGIPLVSGRYFSKEYALDTVSNIIVNESFIKTILPKNVDPLQHPLKSSENTYNIVGVVKDHFYAGFKEKIGPMVFILDRGAEAGMVHVKVKEGRSKEAFAAIQSIYKKFVPFLPIKLESLEDFKLERYAEEIREKKIVTYTAILAIIIACLGLFGLATFMTEQRIKEIGIRKVLGANAVGIAVLLSKDFIRLVIISIIIAMPIGYYFVNKWLENFTYRIEIEWWIFAVVALAAVVIAFLAVFYQSVRASLADPVESLRTE
jgi:putative ABC transport system permease protein